ncbi:MAG: C1 family peptidase, partial [Melioribacteraceae bacterium]|nr:C1 family peptidase [Melioribacteraceae bacterium]
TTPQSGDDGKNDPPYDTGLDRDKELQTIDITPKDLSLITLSDQNINLLNRVMLYDYIPPVRSQENYGTCAAWGAGYYARTIMYARENNLSKTDLENDANVFSPKYLFLSTEYRGENCYGANPFYVMKALQDKGIATWSTVPYDDLGNCSQNTTGDWDNEAANYKIENFRSVDPTDHNALKMYLMMGRPVQLSCNLGLNFFSTKDEVIYDDDYSSEPSEHMYHSMCLVGYDDEKGASGAFRIVNSWGENWGDNGFVWVDYNFFSDKLCYMAYVIEGDKGGLSEAMVDEKVINPNFRVDGDDLLTIQFKDESDPHGDEKQDRVLTYNIFNRGSKTINASDDWNIVYYYYNAFNPEGDFGVILYDYYTDDVGSEFYGKNDDFDNVDVPMDKYGIFNWWNYVDVPAGWSVAKAVYSDDGSDYDFEFSYTIPNLTGDYYFVLMADGFNNIEEQYEQNNFVFFTDENRKPLKIENGIIQNETLHKGKEQSSHAGEMKRSQPNAYNIEEISALINYQKRNGILEAAANKNKSLTKKHPKNSHYGKKIVKAVLNREM